VQLAIQDFLEDFCQVMAIRFPSILSRRFESIPTESGSKFGVLEKLLNHSSQRF
jgi:hypothetical protein